MLRISVFKSRENKLPKDKSSSVILIYTSLNVTLSSFVALGPLSYYIANLYHGDLEIYSSDCPTPKLNFIPHSVNQTESDSVKFS